MEIQRSQERWFNILRLSSASNPLQVPPPKTFRPKVGLPRLDKYSGVNPGKEYWNCWPKNYQRAGKSRIDAEKLRKFAIEAGVTDKLTLSKVYNDLKEDVKVVIETPLSTLTPR